MRIRIKTGWHDIVSKKCRVYPVAPDNRQLIERTMAGLDQAGKAYRLTRQVLFSFPVFVVWAGEGSKKKGRMVVDIRDLNAMSLTDAYPMIQQEVIARIANATHITVMDAMSFYYQWLVHPDSRWTLSFITHDGQYGLAFNVPIMGYKGSNAYVQRRMDNLFRGSAVAGSDDIAIASVGLDQHMRDVREVYQRLLDANVSVGPGKTFMAYPKTKLLGKTVDSLGISTPGRDCPSVAGRRRSSPCIP